MRLDAEYPYLSDRLPVGGAFIARVVGQSPDVGPVGIGHVDPRHGTVGRAMEGDPRTVGEPVGGVTLGDGLPAGAASADVGHDNGATLQGELAC